MSGRECAHPASALLDWYLNGSLEGEEERSVESHLQACPSCARELEEMAELTASLGAHRLPVSAAPASAGAASRRRTWPAYALAAALALTLLAGVVWLTRSEGPSTMELDLGVGLTRNARGIPTLALPPRVDTVRVTFSAPLGIGPGATVELVGPAGESLRRPRPLRGPEPPGVHVVPLAASLFASPGRYALVVRGPGRAQEGARVEFPFEVKPPPSD